MSGTLSRQSGHSSIAARLGALVLALTPLVAHAESVSQVTQISYDSSGNKECVAVRMNPAAFGTLPASACDLGMPGAHGNDRIEKTIYDASGQVVQVRRAVGTQLEQAYVTYAYSPNGLKTELVDANGNRATLEYDGFDRQIKWDLPSKTRPTAFNSAASTSLHPSTTITYSCSSNLTLSGTTCTGIGDIVLAGANNTCPQGYVFHPGNGPYYPATCALTISIPAKATYSCPPGYYPDGKCGRLTALLTAGAANPGDREEYSYDPNGNRLTLRKRDGWTISFEYDALNRVKKKTVPERPGLAFTNTRDVYYRYDLRGLMTSARFDSNVGESVTTSYDGFSRINTSTINLNGYVRTIASCYDKNSNRTRASFPDSGLGAANAYGNYCANSWTNYVTYAFDGLNRPATIQRSGTATIASYGYNPDGSRSAFNGGVNTSYGYDTAGRLSSLSNNLPASVNNNAWTFTYNSANQIVQSVRSNDAFAWTAHANVSRPYTTNGLNQYTETQDGNTGAQTAKFCYDANGNLTADGTSVYLYDVENRLVEKRAQGVGNTNCDTLSYGGSFQAALRYDPIGRLYEVVSSSGATTRFVQDGDALVAEYDGTNNLLRRYVHGADLKSDDPIAWYEGSAYGPISERIMRSDWQGSIVLVSNSTGQSVIAINRYDEFGIPQVTNSGRFQYTGQAWLAELGMYYYKARIYSPTLGRFLQTDPIGYEDQMNLYAYVANDPVNNLDFSGKQLDYSAFFVAMEQARIDEKKKTGRELPSVQDMMASSMEEYHLDIVGSFFVPLEGIWIFGSRSTAQIYATRQAARYALDGPVGAAANRFFKGAGKNARGFVINDLPGGGKLFQFIDPARNPGYHKVYVQIVDAGGFVIKEFKDTMGPNGFIVRKWLHGGP